jgi:probable F420-dependent oxidoreductase
MPPKIGAKIPNSGRFPTEIGIPEMARALEAAGFASLWVSDHVVMPAQIESRYPFAADGRPTWSSDTPYFDAVVALSLVAAVTERTTLGTAVLVLPLRNAVILGKQAATLDVASGGRLELGVGVGWLAEEFAAIGVDFASRGLRFDESIETLRACWTGTLRDGSLCLPTPAHEIPLLVGGHSRVALRRAGAVGDGWVANQSLNGIDVDEIAAARRAMEAAARDAGRDVERLRVVLRITESTGRSDEVARRLAALERAGVDEVVVDVDWTGDPARDFERLTR